MSLVQGLLKATLQLSLHKLPDTSFHSYPDFTALYKWLCCRYLFGFTSLVLNRSAPIFKISPPEFSPEVFHLCIQINTHQTTMRNIYNTLVLFSASNQCFSINWLSEPFIYTYKQSPSASIHLFLHTQTNIRKIKEISFLKIPLAIHCKKKKQWDLCVHKDSTANSQCSTLIWSHHHPAFLKKQNKLRHGKSRGTVAVLL